MSARNRNSSLRKQFISPKLPLDRLKRAARIIDKVFKDVVLLPVVIETSTSHMKAFGRYELLHGEEIVPPQASPKMMGELQRWIENFCNDDPETNETSLQAIISADLAWMQVNKGTWSVKIHQNNACEISGFMTDYLREIPKLLSSDEFLESISVCITNTRTGITKKVPLSLFRLSEKVYRASAVKAYLKGLNETTEDMIKTPQDQRIRRGISKLRIDINKKD